MAVISFSSPVMTVIISLAFSPRILMKRYDWPRISGSLFFEMQELGSGSHARQGKGIA
ncbi:MAG: hypothetical protein ACP5OU_09725 [Methanothrix sp.]